jgi:uncharacterized membrane protein
MSHSVSTISFQFFFISQTRSLKKSHLEEIRNFEVALKAKNEANQLFMEELKEAQAKSENQGGETEILKKVR